MENFYLDNKDIAFHLNRLPLKEIIRMKENDFKEAEEYDYAPSSVKEALENYAKVLEIAGEICGEVIAPLAPEIDDEGAHLVDGEVIYPKGTQIALDQFRKAGLNGVTVPRKYDGLNFPTTIYTMLIEIVARAEAGLMNIFSLQDIGETIYEFADEELRQAYVPRFARGEVTGAMILTEAEAGSDLQRVKTKAVHDEATDTWRLYGTKRFITNGNAQVSLVLARSEEGTSDARGLSMFVIDRDETVKIRRLEDKLGIHGSPTCEMQFNGTPAKLVGKRRMGLIKYVMELMNGARLGIAGQAIGIAEAAYREAQAYATERKQFHKEIINFPAVYEMLTKMRVSIEAARKLTYYTSMAVDYKKLYTEQFEETKDGEARAKMKYYTALANTMTPISKFYSTEMANKVAYDGLQIHGGDGYMKDYNIERHYRDARITNIYEGTTQLQVVAAIGGIVTGSLNEELDRMDTAVKETAWDDEKKRIRSMRERLNAAVALYKEMDDETKAYQAGRIVQMATMVMTSYLLLEDAPVNGRKAKVARIFITDAEAMVKAADFTITDGDRTVIDHNPEIWDI